MYTLSPSSGAGLSQIFTAMYSDTSGYSDIQEAHMLLQTSLTGTNACSPRYIVQSNQLYLLQDSGSGWLGPISPGSGQTLQNSQCRLSGTGSSATGAGNNLTVKFNVTFNTGFFGTKNNYLYVANGGTAFWQPMGTWDVGVLSITSLSPSSGAGLSQIFTAMYSDTSGYSDIQEAHMLLQTSLTGTNACSPRYIVQSNQLYLLQDSGSGWLGPISPGSGQTLQNSQCTLSGTGSSATGAGNNLTVKFNVTFNTGFFGTKNNYLYVTNGGTAFWQPMGTWDIPVGALPDLTITKSHTGNFTQGGTGSYTITAANGGTGATSG